MKTLLIQVLRIKNLFISHLEAVTQTGQGLEDFTSVGHHGFQPYGATHAPSPPKLQVTSITFIELKRRAIYQDAKRQMLCKLVAVLCTAIIRYGFDQRLFLLVQFFVLVNSSDLSQIILLSCKITFIVFTFEFYIFKCDQIDVFFYETQLH